MFASLRKTISNPSIWKASKSAFFTISNHSSKKIIKTPFIVQLNKSFSNSVDEDRPYRFSKKEVDIAFKGYLHLGKQALVRSDLQRAEEEFRKAMDLGIELYGESGEYLAACYFSLGTVLSRQGKKEEGHEFLLKAHKILSQDPQKHRKHLITIETVMGIPAEFSKIRKEEIQEEKTKLLGELAQLQKENNPENLLKIGEKYVFLGNLCRREGNKAEAITYKKKLLEIFEQHPNVTVGDLYINYLEIGNDCKDNKQIDEAMGYFNKALDYLSKHQTENSDDLRFLGLQNIAQIHFTQNNFEEAIKYYTQALELKELSEARDEGVLRIVNFRLGVCNFNTQNPKQAIKFFEKVLEAPQEGGDDVMLASLFKYLGDSYIQVEGAHSERGKRHLERAENYKKAVMEQIKPKLDELKKDVEYAKQNIEAISNN